jgi:hypothetical protein
MRRDDLEPLELDFDWLEEDGTMPSIASTPVPPSGIEWVKLSDSEETWGLEWVEDINETPNMFSCTESETAAETPDAKRGDTLPAASIQESSVESGIHVTIPRLAPLRRRDLAREAVAVVTLEARRRAG